ncbi:PH domain-containing protein [Nocardioides aequoreus]|uniref:PH domain-containing protein n=1 Tax=Nocardioides aequoreus TaxID=397278 RepID=UPI00068E0606|nr:PH domain-containing protein [Nocardioides aequoreus]
MGETVVLRSRAARALGATMVAVGALGAVATLAAGSAVTLRYAALLALFALLGWAAFWRPGVEVSDGGVLVVNTLRSVHVPWPAVEEVEGRYGLRLVTAYGAVQAWGAQAPSGTARARRQDSRAAVVVRERWEALRDAGFLDRRVLERPDLAVTWHRGTLLAVLLLGLCAAAGPALLAVG